jgi:S1-C subfamily serine protease
MVPEQERKPVGKSLLVITILALGLVAVIVFYNGQLGQKTSNDSATISSLHSTISGLQSSEDALRAQVAALSSSSNSSTAGQTSQPAAIYAMANASVVTVQGSVLQTVNTFFGPQSTVSVLLGSGFATVYQSSDYVITNFHVVNGVSNLTVTFGDGNAYQAKVVGTDPYSDLAVVTVAAPPSEFKPLMIVQSTPGVTVGQIVYAIGNPFGLSGSLTTGIVSQLGRTIQEATAGSFSISGVIQFSAPINPGNSGGPLLNSNANVIGITTATVSSSQGIGFAIPSSTIIRELPSLVSSGSYNQHAYLGIGGTDMTLQLAQAMKLNVTYGVLIESVTSGGPASKAGLRVGTQASDIEGTRYLLGGDVIVSINGAKIVNQDALAAYLEQNTVAGQTVHLGVYRSGSLMTVDAVLGSRPAPPSG